MDDIQIQLLSEQLARFKDGIDARLKRLEADLRHHQNLEEERLTHLKMEISHTGDLLDDHEKRIRSVDDAVIALKTSTSLAQAGQAALTLIAAAIATWLGGQTQ